MSKIILGIDPGIADTGYGIISQEDRGKIVCLGYGSIKTSSKKALAERLLELNQELGKIIKKYKPQTAAIEQLFLIRIRRRL